VNILQVCPRYPPQSGGVETLVWELSERLVGRGHRVTVHTADAGAGGKRRERRKGVKLRRHRGLAPGGAFHLAPGVLGDVLRADADVVHAHNVHSLPLPLAALGAGETPLVASTYFHGASAISWRNALWRAYRPLAGVALRRSDRVVAVSDWERARLRADLDVTADVIPIGIDRDRFEGVKPIDHGRPYLLCVARLVEYKGVQHVVRALPNLDEYDLFVAGDGPYRERLAHIADETGVADRVTFLGFVDLEALPAYYAGAAVYLALSSFESYGITVAEALASGTPCVIRTGSALEGWLSNTGVVGIETTSPGAVGSAVREIESRTPDGTGLADWPAVVDAYERAYEQARPPPPQRSWPTEILTQ